MTDAHQKRKLTWLIKGTRHQRPRPMAPRFSPGEEVIAAQVQDEVVRQFEQARDEQRVRLDLRPRFRAWANALVKGLQESIRGSRPKADPDGKPTGGSLASGLRRMLKMKRWGFVLDAGSRAGVRLAVVGVKRAEKVLEQVAVERIRAEGLAGVLVTELERTRAEAQQLERAARAERSAARGRP